MNARLKKTTSFLILFIVGGTLLFLSGAFATQEKKEQAKVIKDKRPNVVIIMADDLDSRQLSCYGGQNLETTNIDALAREGMLFKNMICSEAMCVPTRASLFTGLYPVHHGSYQNHKPVYDSIAIKSVPHYLGNLGYRVALTGKDHSTKPREGFPFEIIEGFQPMCTARKDVYSLDGITDFVKTSQDPFCLFVMSINPHAPWTVGDPSEFDADKLILPPSYVDTPTTRKDYTKYLAEVRRLDDQVGDVVKMLKEQGKYDETIIIFLGEQGPQMPGGKWSLWDMGQKSSMVVKWDKTVTPHSTTDAIVQYEDIVPTLIDVAGGKPISGLDGKSFLPVLKGDAETAREYAYGIHNNIPEGTAYPIRSVRDGRYKLVANLTPDEPYYLKWFMNPKNNSGIWFSWLEEGKKSSEAQALVDRITTRPAEEFYDLINDPYELHNLIDDSRHKDKIAIFENALKDWMNTQGDKGAALDKPIHKKKPKQNSRK